MRKQTCETCGWWNELEHTKDGEIGECRKSAPITVLSKSVLWPTTFASDWCGDHENRKVK